jgi:hypothetical protein
MKDGAKVQDRVKVSVISVYKFRCEHCGFYTRDRQEGIQHECNKVTGDDNDNSQRQGQEPTQ